MLAPIRTLISVAFIASLVYCSFTVDLGGKTFAEHADAIGETGPAKALVNGARSTINPALDATKERILGEYVEAPTALAGGTASSGDTKGAPRPVAPPDPASERPLPGRR